MAGNLMSFCHDCHKLCLDSRGANYREICQDVFRDRYQCIWRPLLEPVYRTPRYQTRKLKRSRSEFRSNLKNKVICANKQWKDLIANHTMGIKKIKRSVFARWRRFSDSTDQKYSERYCYVSGFIWNLQWMNNNWRKTYRREAENNVEVWLRASDEIVVESI